MRKTVILGVAASMTIQAGGPKSPASRDARFIVRQ
jgi:hypothetical protein